MKLIWNISRGVGGRCLRKKSLLRGGMDIFWNNTFVIFFFGGASKHCISLVFLLAVDLIPCNVATTAPISCLLKCLWTWAFEGYKLFILFPISWISPPPPPHPSSTTRSRNIPHFTPGTQYCPAVNLHVSSIVV